jgi:hypothetical protein
MRVMGLLMAASFCAASALAQTTPDSVVRTQEIKQDLLAYWQSIDSLECEYVHQLEKKGEDTTAGKTFFKFKGDWIWCAKANFKDDGRETPKLSSITCETNITGEVESYYFGETRGPRTLIDLTQSPWTAFKGLLTGNLSYDRKSHLFLEKRMAGGLSRTSGYRSMWPNEFNPLTIAGKSSAVGYTSYEHSLRAIVAGLCPGTVEETDGGIRLNLDPQPWQDEVKNPEVSYHLVFHLTRDGLVKQIDYMRCPSCSAVELAIYAYGKAPELICFPICTDYFDAFVLRRGIHIPTRLKRVIWGYAPALPGAVEAHHEDMAKFERGEMSQCEFELRSRARRITSEGTVISLEILPDSLQVNNPGLGSEDFAVYSYHEAAAAGNAPHGNTKVAAMPEERSEWSGALRQIRLEDLDALHQESVTRGNLGKVVLVFSLTVGFLVALYVVKRRV